MSTQELPYAKAAIHPGKHSIMKHIPQNTPMMVASLDLDHDILQTPVKLSAISVKPRRLRNQTLHLQHRHRERELGLRRVICALLGVEPAFSESLSLSQLRIYARAYRSDLPEPWTIDGLSDCTAHGAFFMSDNEDGPYHVAEMCAALMDLAISRGDIGTNGMRSHRPVEPCQSIEYETLEFNGGDEVCLAED